MLAPVAKHSNKMPVLLSLIIIFAILASAIILSLAKNKAKKEF